MSAAATLPEMTRSSNLGPNVLAATAGALIMGADYRGLGVVRSLGRRGIPVWVIKQGGHLVAPPLGTLAATYLGHPRTQADKLTSSSTWRPNMVSTDGCSFPPTTTRSPLFPAIIRRWRVTTGSPCLLGKNCAGPATSGSCIILPTTSGFNNPGLLLQTPERNSQHSTTLSP